MTNELERAHRKLKNKHERYRLRVKHLGQQIAELREMVREAKPLVAYAHADAEIDRTEYGGWIESECTRWLARAAEVTQNEEATNGNV